MTVCGTRHSQCEKPDNFFQAKNIRTEPLVHLFTIWLYCWLAYGSGNWVHTECDAVVPVPMTTKTGIRTARYSTPGLFWAKAEVHLELLTSTPPLVLSEDLAFSSFRIAGLKGCAAWGSEDTPGARTACPPWVKDHKLFGRGRNTEEGCEHPLASCWEFLSLLSQ